MDTVLKGICRVMAFCGAALLATAMNQGIGHLMIVGLVVTVAGAAFGWE